MTSGKSHTPIYKRFIQLIRAGLDLLDDEAQNEIQQFVVASQHANGGFIDRGGKSDLYYSLFGFWLASALNMDVQLMNLKQFICNYNKKDQKNPIDYFAYRLIEIGLNGKDFSRNQWIKDLFRRDSNANFTYQLFLFLLVFEAQYGKKAWINFIVRQCLRFYKTPASSPCSMIAAFTIAKHEVGLETKNMDQQLLAYFDDKQGFRTFEYLETSDMLSTAVALFALREVDFDLRICAPACLNFIQQNYIKGAFISGDGDETRDLEYTFYGMLALGVLGASSITRETDQKN